MAKNLELNIHEALKNQSATTKTFENADKRAKKYKRNTTQINIYLKEKELKYVDEKCDELFLSRVSFFRKLLAEEMKKQ